MTVFADSSALVKLYALEDGAEHVEDLDALVASELAMVEVPAALWRKHRLGELDGDAARVLVGRFAHDARGDRGGLPRFALVAARPVIDTAAALVARHPLRAYDAVQLASALAARARDPSVHTFACFDRALSAAALAEGFEPLPAA